MNTENIGVLGPKRGLPPLEKGTGSVVFLKMQVLLGGVGVSSDIQITKKGVIVFVSFYCLDFQQFL